VAASSPADRAAMETENAQWLDRRSGSALDTITGPAVTSSHITIRSLLLESATSEEPSCRLSDQTSDCRDSRYPEIT